MTFDAIQIYFVHFTHFVIKSVLDFVMIGDNIWWDVKVQAWKDKIVYYNNCISSKYEGDRDSLLETRYQLNSCSEIKLDFFENLI